MVLSEIATNPCWNPASVGLAGIARDRILPGVLCAGAACALTAATVPNSASTAAKPLMAYRRHPRAGMDFRNIRATSAMLCFDPSDMTTPFESGGDTASWVVAKRAPRPPECLYPYMHTSRGLPSCLSQLSASVGDGDLVDRGLRRDWPGPLAPPGHRREEQADQGEAGSEQDESESAEAQHEADQDHEHRGPRRDA